MRVRIDRMRRLPAALLLAASLVSGAGCGDDPVSSDGDSNADSGDPPGDTADTTPPGAVADLRVQSVVGSIVTLAWTAPGDDAAAGTAAAYDIRTSGAAITGGTWDAATPLAGAPAPAAPGTQQTVSFDVTSRSPVYVALKTSDEVPNWSAMSNVVLASPPAPFEVRQLTSVGKNTKPCVSEGVVTWIREDPWDGDDIWRADLNDATPTPERVTDDGGEKGRMSAHADEKIVWAGRVDSSEDWEIWVYDRTGSPTISAFTDNAIDDVDPVLAGGGDFAWCHGHFMFEAIHYWDASAMQESIISDDETPTSTWACDTPAADDGMVVWRAFNRSTANDHKTVLWDGASTDISAVINANVSLRYSLHDGLLAYESSSTGTWVTLWDGSTIQSIEEGLRPSLHDGAIAYTVWDGDYEVHFWDGATIHELTDNHTTDAQPSVGSDWIVWVANPPGSYDGQIFYARRAR